eukprot:m.96559 g.96559  ORF g.96559 m.96559 type:complete len:137 (-) comp26904_c0_seq1:163-573(-)
MSAPTWRRCSVVASFALAASFIHVLLIGTTVANTSSFQSNQQPKAKYDDDCGTNFTDNTFWDHTKCAGVCCTTFFSAEGPDDCCMRCQLNATCAVWEWGGDEAVCYMCTAEVVPHRGQLYNHVSGCVNESVCQLKP